MEKEEASIRKIMTELRRQGPTNHYGKQIWTVRCGGPTCPYHEPAWKWEDHDARARLWARAQAVRLGFGVGGANRVARLKLLPPYS